MYVPTIRKDPNHWWDGLGKAVREAVEKSGVPEGEIVSIGIDTTCCSVVALDKNVSSAAGTSVRWAYQSAVSVIALTALRKGGRTYVLVESSVLQRLI